MYVHDHLPLDELQRLAKTITGKRVWLRYQAIIRAIQGRSATEVAQALGWSVRAFQKWVARSNQCGPQALAERPYTGMVPFGRRGAMASPSAGSPANSDIRATPSGRSSSEPSPIPPLRPGIDPPVDSGGSECPRIDRAGAADLGR